jgi:type II secretory pathway component PulJ
MTLVEVMVATVLGTLILAGAGSLMVYNVRSLAALTNYTDLDRYSRNAVDRISRDVRQAATLASFTTTELRFTFPSAPDVRYIYDPRGRTLVRTQGTSDRTVLLEECDSLTFTVYGRNNISNSWDQFEVTTAANAKLIKLNWTCSRTILGEARNTESIQTAKVVLRKQD